MTKQDLWAAYVAKNPSFNGDGNVTMSAAGLKKLFEQTYDKAHEAGVKNGKALEQMKNQKAEKEKPDDPMSDLFGSMFGTK